MKSGKADLSLNANDYKIIPLVGNAVLEAEMNHTKRIIVRVTMQHAARYGFIAQIMNDMAAKRRIRIFNNEEEPVCVKCGGPLVHGTRVCPKCMSKAAAFKRLFLVSQSHWKKLALGLSRFVRFIGNFADRAIFSEIID